MQQVLPPVAGIQADMIVDHTAELVDEEEIINTHLNVTAANINGMTYLPSQTIYPS